MNPFSPEHEELRDSIRRFVANELRPHVREWEDARWFPNDVFTRMGELGFLGLKYPEEYGGQGGDYLHDAVLTEELSRSGSGGLAAGIGAHIGIATPPVWKFGTEDQKQRYLAPAIRGEKIAALGITEPDAGSDVAAHQDQGDAGRRRLGRQRLEDVHHQRRPRRLRRHRRQDHPGGRAPRHQLPARRHRPAGLRGVEDREARLARLRHGADRMDEVFVPEENLLGAEHEGFKLIMANFQWERLLMSLGSVSAMQAAFEKTVAFVAQREAFGRPIGKFQVLRHRLADHATTIHAARTVTYDALARFAAGEDVVKEVTMAKLITQRGAYDLIDDCLQMHGGAGYMEEYDIERAARDSRLGPIGGGTDEIMREILAKVLGL